MFVKHFAVAGAALVSVLALGACSGLPATPAATGSVSCGGGSFQTSVAPAIVVAHGEHLLTSVGPSSEAPCSDGTGTGITSARIEHMSVSFRSLGCSGSDEVGQGTATVRWSDGSTSAAIVLVLLDSALTGNFAVRIVDGHLAGYSGSADFFASPSAGDCASGITTETVTIGGLTLTAD